MATFTQFLEAHRHSAPLCTCGHKIKHMASCERSRWLTSLWDQYTAIRSEAVRETQEALAEMTNKAFHEADKEQS